MGNPAVDRDAHYTYRHYLTWPYEERWELIQGHAWVMSLAPLTDHQRVATRISRHFLNFAAEGPMEVFIAPFDVLLPRGDEPDEEVDTVVQPDLCVYCDPRRVTRRGGRGSPDLVVEIISAWTSRKDLREKYDLYERCGVREYWVIDPGNRSLCVYGLTPKGVFDEGDQRDEVSGFGIAESRVLEGLRVEVEALFVNLD